MTQVWNVLLCSGGVMDDFQHDLVFAVGGHHPRAASAGDPQPPSQRVSISSWATRYIRGPKKLLVRPILHETLHRETPIHR